MKRILLIISIFAMVYFPINAQQISGTIATETGVLIENVEVPPSSTNAEGYYEIQNPTTPFTVEPFKNDGPLNGVNVCDLVAITRHILGTQSFNSPYKVIAADANRSCTVTTLDVALFSQILLGIMEDFEPSWLFMDKNYEFPGPFDPLGSSEDPSVIVVNSLDQEVAADFIGIKMGDTNNSVIGSYPNLLIPEAVTLPFEFADALVPQQNEYLVDFTAKDFLNESGFQLTLNYDPSKMEFIELIGTGLSNPSTLQSNLIEPGVLAALWVEYSNMMIPDGAVVFSAKFNILDDVQLAESLQFTSDFLPIILSNAEGCLGEPEAGPISSQENITSLSSIELFPNPTNGLFDLQLEFNSTKEVSVTLYDVVGVKMLEKNYNNQLVRDQIDIAHLVDGIYFLSINVDGEILTKQIVKE